MAKLQIFRTACALVALAGSASAQSQPQNLTLEQVLRDAESVNLSILMGRESITQSEENARLVRSGLLPQVSLQAAQSRNDLGANAPSPALRLQNDFSAGINAALSVFDLSQFASLRAARQAVVVSRYDYETAVQGVMAAVADVYFEHLRDLAFDKVIDANIERANVLLTLARNQLEAGVATQIDVTRAEAELVTQQQAKLQQQTVVLSSALRIQRLLHLELDAPLALETFPLRRSQPTDLPIIDDVLARRAEYRAAQAQLEQIRFQRSAAGNERLPALGVFGEVGQNGGVAFEDNERYWTAGVQLSVPVFDGSRIRANERIADSRRRQQEFRLVDLRNQIDSELRIARQAAESQLATIGVAEKNLALATEELRLARVRYEQGVADNRELIEAENRFTSANFNLVGATYGYNVARVELARVRGDVRLILDERQP